MRVWLWSIAPVCLVPLLFVIVLALGRSPLVRTEIPDEPRVAQRCSWYCHNHNCPHHAVLPAVFSGDRGLYGKTISALHAAGQGTNEGYALANLALFCVAWPGAMWALWIIAVRQRARLRLRAAR